MRSRRFLEPVNDPYVDEAAATRQKQPPRRVDDASSVHRTTSGCSTIHCGSAPCARIAGMARSHRYCTDVRFRHLAAQIDEPELKDHSDSTHALRGHPACGALRHDCRAQETVHGRRASCKCVPTRSVGTIKRQEWTSGSASFVGGALVCRVDDASPVHRSAIATVDEKSAIHPTG